MENKTKGSGLIFAVVLLFVILGMVITLSSVTVLETKMNQKTKSSVGAFYNSESGVEWALNLIASKSDSDDISTIPGWNASGYAPCPDTFGVDACKVYFLDKTTNNVITVGTTDISEIAAVRSVGSQGGETQRAIEAAVAAGGDGCFTNYCNTSTAQGGKICATNCPSGFTDVHAMGSWGYCVHIASGVAISQYFSPPGAGCGPDGYGGGTGNYDGTYRSVGDAYLCCTN